MTIPLWLLCGIWFVVGWLGCALIDRLTDANGRVKRDSKGRFESDNFDMDRSVEAFARGYVDNTHPNGDPRR